jgi:hypothetical protein
MAQRDQQNDLASLMYPSLSRQARQQDADRERRKQQLLKHLREANAEPTLGCNAKGNHGEIPDHWCRLALGWWRLGRARGHGHRRKQQ